MLPMMWNTAMPTRRVPIKKGQLKNTSARNSLIEEYRGYVNSVVRKMVHSMNLPNDLVDEFVAAGYLGLVEAAQRYDEKSGREFKSFAFLRIRGAVIDSIRECSDVSGRAYRCARALQAVHEIRDTDHGIKNVRRQQKVALNTLEQTSDEKLAEVLEFASKAAFVFRLTVNDAEHEMTANADPNDAESEIILREKSECFLDLIAKLPEKERLIIEEYYINGKSFSEIMERHKDFSKSWISRLHSRAISHLKENYYAAMLAKDS